MRCVCGGLRLGGGSTLTDAGDDEEHEQRVGHGQHGLGQRAEDVLERLHAAEEPDHAQGAHDAQHVGGHGDGAERDQREGDHDHVQLVPAVGGEAEEPVREHVDQELGGEDGREEDVDALEDARLAGGGGVLGRDAGGGDANAALGGGDAGEEVLPARASGRGAVMLYFSPRVARRSSCSVENIEVQGRDLLCSGALARRSQRLGASESQNPWWIHQMALGIPRAIPLLSVSRGGDGLLEEASAAMGPAFGAHAQAGLIARSARNAQPELRSA